MKKINYLITAIILTFFVTVYAKHSSTSTLESQFQLSKQNKEVLSSLLTKLKFRVAQKSLTSTDYLFPCIVDSGN